MSVTSVFPLRVSDSSQLRLQKDWVTFEKNEHVPCKQN